jgi:hypothetical protein
LIGNAKNIIIYVKILIIYLIIFRKDKRKLWNIELKFIFIQEKSNIGGDWSYLGFFKVGCCKI